MTLLYTQYKNLDASRALVSLPMKTVYRESDTTEKLTDGTAEAVGTAAWTLVSGTSVTKQAGSRPGGSGVQVVRLTGVVNSYMRQTAGFASAGKVIRLRGWAIGDGTAVPALIDSSGTTLWVGSATQWRYYDLLWVPVGNLYWAVLTAGGYVDFDDCSAVAELSKTPNIGSLGGGALLGADGYTLASMPTLTPMGMKFDGVDDTVRISSPGQLVFGSAGVDSPFSVEMLCIGRCAVFKGAWGGTEEWGVWISTDDKLYIIVNTSSVAYLQRGTANVVQIGCPNHLMGVYDGSKTSTGLLLYINGVLQPLSSFSAGVYTGMSDKGGYATFGSIQGLMYRAGTNYDLKVWPWALTPSQIKFRAERARAEMRLI